MKRKFTLFALLLGVSALFRAQTTVTITAVGTAGSYNSGSVNSVGTKNDGNMTTINVASNAGWAMFDLSSLPPAAVVTAVTCSFTTYSSTFSSGTNNLYGFVGTPSSMAGTALYTACTSGTSFNASAWAANAAIGKVFNASGISFIQTNIPSSNVCIGFKRGSSNTYNIYGYPGASGQQPMLVITYTLQPPCSGMPNAGTAIASSTQVCAPQSVNLSLSGSTAASGLTYQWESSPDGTTWTSIPTATNPSTAQGGTTATYYHCIVSCGTNTATSTPVMVNYSIMPTGTTVASSTLTCVGQSIAFSLSGSTSYPGMTYQWQSSPNGSTWTSIPSETLATTNQSQISNTYYQAVLTCGSSTAVSSPVLVNMVTPASYATVPYLETFDNTWQARCDIQNVPVSANWSSNPTTGNPSWRRQDAGTTALWNSPGTGTVTPIGTGCADFHSYFASAGTTGNLDLYVDMGTPSNYVMSFYNFNNSGSDSLRVYLSTNGGSTFTFKGSYGVATSWTKQTITLGAVNSPSCVVRLLGVSDYGNDDIGVDSLRIFTAACTTPPVAGTITGPATVAINSTNSFSVSPTTGSIQWYSATSPSGPWSTITNATNTPQSLTTNIPGSMYLTVVASSVGCPNDTSNVPLSVYVNFPGDDVCNAIPLTVGPGTTYYYPAGATTQSNEVVPLGGGCSTYSTWCNTNLNNSMWFSFTAPASGYVSIHSPGFDTQIALWNASSCNGLLSASTATLLAANDDDPDYATHGGVNYSSYLERACLTPGATYYIQLDSYNTAISTDSTKVIITDMGTLNMGFTGLSANYCLPSSVTASLTPAVTGGIFTINTSTPAITGFTPSVAGVGTFTISHSMLGCVSNSITSVANTPVVTASASTPSICSGSTATLTASGATSYTWSSGPNSASTVESPTISTTYTVTGETSGCSGTDIITLTVSTTPSVNVTTTSSVICAGSTVTMTATGAASYTWNTGAMASGIVESPTVSTTYSVTGDNSGCTGSATIAVSVNPSPAVTAVTSSTMICIGQSATLTASGANTYTWSTGTTSATTVESPTTTVSYTVTGEDVNGCTADFIISQSVFPCTGIESAKGTIASVHVYPNPNNGLLNIVVPDMENNVVFELYDALGKTVAVITLTDNHNKVNIADIAVGIYSYRIKSGNLIYGYGKLVRE